MAMSSTKRQKMIKLEAILILSEEFEYEATRRKRKTTLPYVIRRQQLGAFHALVQELAEQVSCRLIDTDSDTSI